MSVYLAAARESRLLLTYLVLQVCVQFFKLTANIFLEAKSACCLVSVFGLPTLLVHKIIQLIYSVMLTLSFLSTGVNKSNKCHCGPVPRETCIFHIPGQVLACVVVSGFMVITLWRHLSAEFIFSLCGTTS